MKKLTETEIKEIMSGNVIKIINTPLSYLEHPELSNNGGCYQDTTVYTRQAGGDFEVSYESTMEDCDPCTGEALWGYKSSNGIYSYIDHCELEEILRNQDFIDEPTYRKSATSIKVDGKYIGPSYYK